MKLKMIFLLALLMVFSSCAKKTEREEGKIYLVATTTLLADMANEIGGEYVQVDGLMGPGLDPHLYQASARDVVKMQNADVVLYGGLHLEGKMNDVFEALAKNGRTMICAADGLDKNELIQDRVGDNFYDPHVWFDVMLWKDEAKYLADQLSIIDPEHENAYQANYERYARELDDLESYMKERVAEIPEKQRVLVTAHDAFTYFARAYGFEVKALQGISTDAEAGTGDMSKLADFIADNTIKAIFVESSVPTKAIDALQAAVRSRGFDVGIGGELHSDSLGDQDSNNTYIKMMQDNIDTITDALR